MGNVFAFIIYTKALKAKLWLSAISSKKFNVKPTKLIPA
jgi:hypothetical protein